MKLLVIGDIHLADRPPSIRHETYAAEILGKLQFAVRHASEVGCEGVFLAGDVFHIKTPNRNSHRLVQDTVDVLTSTGLPVRVVPGNHDMQHDRIESLPQQPLGTLCKASGIDLLIGPDREFPVFGLPYLYDWVRDLPEHMDAYTRWADEAKAADVDFWPLMVTHAPLFPPGREVIYEFIDSADWADMMQKGACYYGHIHDPHGSYVPKPSLPVVMCNQGALSRGSLHEATLRRKPAVTVWDSTAPLAEQFTRVEVPHKPAEEVFRLKEREIDVEREGRLDAFLAGVEETVLHGLTLEEVVAHAEGKGYAPGTLKELRSCVEEVLSRG